MSTEFPRVKVTAYIDGLAGSERVVDAMVHGEPGKRRAWVSSCRVTVRFRTGTKVHSDFPHGWEQADGRFKITRHTVIHNRSCSVTGWLDDAGQANSGWTGDKKPAASGEVARG